MELRLFQVDAFTDRLFRGNPAGVVPLEAWLSDEVLGEIARENNLAETAFFVPAVDRAEEGRGVDFDLRWFTPEREVDLCGHATVASAHVLVNHLGWARPTVRFRSQSGILGVARQGEHYALDFPARPPVEVDHRPDVAAALGGEPASMLTAERDFLVVYGTEGEVGRLRPRMDLLEGLEDVDSVIVSAPAQGDDVDFVSRFFAPKYGIPEDPATGSAHCTLVPYWARRLEKSVLRGRQVSRRVGDFYCRHEADSDRVGISGGAVTYLEGVIRVGTCS